MRIENLLYLLDGELKSSPSIKKIGGFSCEASLVKRGDLFFAKNKKEIELAVKNGAYSIVFEGWTQIIDNEIAWIKVKNLQNSALKLLRFFLIQNQIPLFRLDYLEYEMAKTLDHSLEILFLEKDFVSNLIQLSKKEKKIALIYDNEIFKKLSLDNYEIKTDKKIKILNSYLFETSFIYNNIYYERVNISPLFIKNLDKVLNIFELFFINYHIKNIENLNRFKPIFVDSYFNRLDFGKSDRVLIIENDYDLLQREREFLEEKAKWAKKIYISDKDIKDFILAKDFDKIRDILYNKNFNFALIGAKDFDLSSLLKNKKIMSLF